MADSKNSGVTTGLVLGGIGITLLVLLVIFWDKIFKTTSTPQVGTTGGAGSGSSGGSGSGSGGTSTGGGLDRNRLLSTKLGVDNDIPEVRELQKELNTRFGAIPPLTIDGKFGPLTEEALQKATGKTEISLSDLSKVPTPKTKGGVTLGENVGLRVQSAAA